ncbi:succinylglutamate desuccinylase/aspartoacylase family protein [Caballeronia sp. LZ035]|uniref:succinylglutamate desuccinylase/aspartoacylase domain-containing protein n=1 Tax=Caballeronia sp. LZ035 TaxID=3038568 RepID=UPI0028581285|nr:succinylglutamate desuccinylase/aspartoacylase family protein [Caballeronia sp. LZ035]MDR5758796.1 succinylglutamate desuccinylase/aspartoacylase family protein [Caballeronia sp. LZ035]
MNDTLDVNRPGKHTYSLAERALGSRDSGDDTLTCITNGAGPSVVVCGGIHGDEYEPQIVLRRLIASLDATDVAGRLIIVPSLNFPAAHDGRRVSVKDGLNMNRTFPGDRNGSVTQRLSAFLNDALFPHCDLLVDVHAGGSGCIVVPMVFGWTAGQCSMTERDLDGLMETWGYPYVQHVPVVDTTSCGAALIANIPSIEIEGGGGSLSASELELMLAGLRRGLRAYGVLKAAADADAVKPAPAIHLDVTDDNQYFAPVAGVIEHTVALRDFVDAGQVVALMHSVDGAYATREVVARRPGHVLRQSTLGFVGQGALVGNTGTPRRQA